MDCVANHSIFLRSNGAIACWCDAGCLKVLQAFDRTVDYARDVYLGKVFSYIRESLAADRQPFPSVCSKCMVLAPEAKYSDYYSKHRIVATFQIEPSFACQLDCPGCIPLHDRKKILPKTEHGHLLLDPAVLEKILTDLAMDGIRIERIDFQGHGEPTLHPRVWDMVSMARQLFPSSILSMCTNAQKEFSSSILDAGLDEILFAIDGMDQASYVPYRVRGDFDLAYDFMRAYSLGAIERGLQVKTVWKYVLFNHNDSEEQLLRAQVLAHEASVRELRFIVTQLGPSSTSIVDESQIPRARLPLNVRVENYKVHLDQLVEGIRLAERLINQEKAKPASDSVLFVVNMLTRNLQGAKAMPAIYRPLLDDLERVTGRLPEQFMPPIRNGLSVLHTMP